MPNPLTLLLVACLITAPSMLCAQDITPAAQAELTPPATETQPLPAGQDNSQSLSRQQLLIGLEPATDLDIGMQKLGKKLQDLRTTLLTTPGNRKILHAKVSRISQELIRLRNISRKLRNGFSRAEKYVPSNGGSTEVETLRLRFDSMLKELEIQDRLGDYKIQDLLTAYQQAEKLAASVRKKKNDTAKAIISKTD